MMLSRHRRIMSLPKSSPGQNLKNYIKKKQFRDDLREAPMAYIDLAQLEKVHTKASSKIKSLGRSVSQRRMPW